MSSKKDSNTPKNNKASNRGAFFRNIAEFFKSDRVRTFLGLCLFMFVIYLIVPYTSYFSSGGEDQSLIDAASDISAIEAGAEVQNAGGIRGAQLADYLVNQTFGAPSLFIILFLAVAGLKMMRVTKSIKLRRWFFGCLFLLLWGSLFLGYVFMPLYKDGFLYLGGYYGYLASLWLETQIGKAGVIILIVLFGLSISIYLSERSVEYIRSVFKLEFLKRLKREQKNKPDSFVDHEDGEDTNYFEEPKQTVELTDGDKEDKLTIEKDVITINDNLENDFTDSEQNNIAITPSTDFEEKNDVSNHSVDDDKDGLSLEIEVKEDDVFTGDLLQPYNPKLSLSNYKFPTLELMKDYGNNEPTINEEEQNANKNKIINTLQSFGIEIKTIKATVGPTVTLYEITPEQGVRISKIRGLEDDIALSLAALGIRIIAPIPGKGTIGIEVPNAHPKIVSGRSIINSNKFQNAKYDLPIAFGKTITNEVFVVDLCKMPHILVAGATGQGKSVGLNTIITSLLYKKHPAELKFVLIDPKKVEFSIYTAIKDHYLAQLPDTEEPIITDVTKVVHTLNSVCVLMDRRYDLLKDAKVRNIKEYNDKFINRRLNPEKGHDYMPYLVVVIDEFGDLIMTAGKEIELPIARIAQLARAVGIHMIIATQRPTTNIITGTIKANFPARVAFRVSSMMDSRTILDRPGANQLIGKGDMLFLQGADPIRVQCAFIDTPEVEEITQYIAKQPSFNGPFELPEYTPEDGEGALDELDTTRLDALFEDAARLIVATQQGSTSMIQRKFSIGYNRAGRIMDQMERAGIVGAADGSKPRQVLIQDENSLQNKLNNY